MKIISNKQNIGVAQGNNQGILAAQKDGCSHVLLINNDTTFESGLVDKLINGVEELKCDMIAPKIVYHEDTSLLWFAGGHFNKWLPYLNIHEGMLEEDQGQYDYIREIEYAPTCCMLVCMDVFDRIGLMDEKYFVYYDDTDFCMRALRAKKRMYYLPGIKFTHKVSSLTGGGESNFSIRYTVRNKIYFIKKHVSFPFKDILIWLTLLKYYLQRMLKLVDIRKHKVKVQAFWEGYYL